MGLDEMEYEGKKVVHRVFDTREVYSGPYLSSGPDLIVVPQYGFDMKGSIKKENVFGKTDLQGMHTWDDAFFLAPKKHGEDLSISDLSEIILDSF